MPESCIAQNPRKQLNYIVLAAGLSQRMGCCKLALPWCSDTILGHTLAQAEAGGCSPLTVISGAYQTQVEQIAQTKGASCLYNPDYATGQASSLRCALVSLPVDAGMMFILADQPLVPPEVYATLRQAYLASDAWLIAPQDDSGKRGNPVIIAPNLRPEIASLQGDEGARSLFALYPEHVLLVPCSGSDYWLDIDTPEDYARLL